MLEPQRGKTFPRFLADVSSADQKLPSTSSTSFIGLVGSSSQVSDDISIRKLEDTNLASFSEQLLLIDFDNWKKLHTPNKVLDTLHSKNQRIAVILPAFNEDKDWHEFRKVFGKEYNHPAFGTCLDVAKALSENRRPAIYRHLDLSRLQICIISDSINTGEIDFCLPGLGNLNLVGFIHLLVRGGFIGPWAIKVPKSLCTSVGFKQTERALLNLLDAAGENTPKLQNTLPDLPPKAIGMGVEFIEFAIDDTNQDQLENQLLALGFRRERRHRFKPVVLWRQGAINIVLNRSPEAARSLPKHHGPFVCDMGLKVGDGPACVARSKAMGATPFLTQEHSNEVSIPAIVEESGSMVHLLDERSETHRVWDLDFIPLNEPWAGQPAGLRRIDHVAQTYTTREMHRWMLFYLSTFKMHARSAFDVSDLAGLVNSRAIETPEGEIRLTLNGTDDTKTLAGKFVGQGPKTSVQHIAFQTDDIFETSNLIAARGFKRLSIESAYYDNLGERFNLSATQVKDLHAANILYSEDEKGHFYQIYSMPLTGGFFFEIVQRCNGYRGYGSANAAVRLRAQSNFISKDES